MAVTTEQLEKYRAARVAATARWREHNRSAINARRRAAKRAQTDARPWIFVDGEGWGEDALGRQCYRLMTAATDDGFEDSLVAASERLGTEQVLEWLCWLVPHYQRWCKRNQRQYLKPNIAGFGLGYDYAHILLDLNLEQLEAIFHNQDHEAPWVEFGGEGAAGDVTRNGAKPAASYLLKLTAGHLQVKRLVAGKQLGYAGIWDVYRYFKGGFAQASAHLMTPDEKAIVEAGKARRGEAEHDAQTELEYAAMECRVGSRLVKTLEDQGRSLELYPTSWYGPGSLAHLALKNQGVGASYKKDEEHDPGLIEAARRAFVGGRFETTGHGRLPFLMEYDIKSAYPHAITHLPCLQHTSWHLERLDKDVSLAFPPRWTLYHVQWDNHGEPLAGGWGPWPTRVQPGKVVDGEDGFDAQMLPVWPWKGETWVWQPEFYAGLKLLERSPRATWKILEQWVPINVEGCSCRPFAWVDEWYYRRQAMAAAGDVREWWLKLILNSLYGKFAQMVGRAVWHSWLWAGMITAHTRAQLLTAIAQDPEAVVMTATDAVYAVRGLDLEIGSGLGQWEGQALGKAFVVQSGFFDSEAIYGEGHPRTRGLPARYIDWGRFQELWSSVLRGDTAWDQAKVVVDSEPATGRKFQIHVGIGLAQLWGKPEKLGQWLDYPTTLTFVTDKRPMRWVGPQGDHAAEQAGEWEEAQEAAETEIDEIDEWPELRREILNSHGIGPSPDWDRSDYPGDLFRRHGRPPDIVAVETPPWMWTDDREMFDYLHRAYNRHNQRLIRSKSKVRSYTSTPTPIQGEWLYTQPWHLPSNPGSEYRPGRGIGEDKFMVMDQPDATEWADMA